MDTTIKTTTELTDMLNIAKDNGWLYGHQGNVTQQYYWRGYEEAIFSILNPNMMDELATECHELATDEEGRARLRGFNHALKAAGYTS